MEKSIELRVKNPLENSNEYDRRMARDLLTEKEPALREKILDNWSNATQRRTIGRLLSDK